MALNPFVNPPRAKFLVRALPILLLTYLVSLSVLGRFVPEGSGFGFQRSVFSRVMNIPEVCLSGNTVSDFQSRQCDEFWSKLTSDALVALSPVLVAFVVSYLLLDHLSHVYRQARRRIEKGQAIARGTVTNPPELPQQSFGWFHCLNAYSIQLDSGAQMRVYLPEDAPKPRPGEQLAVFDGGKSFGAQRYFGMLYAPHMAIVRGGKPE